MEKYEEIKEYVKKTLSEKRFYHSQCVEERCIEFARIHNVDTNKARLIGIAHDIAKEMTTEEKMKIINDNNIKVTKVEIKSPGLLHATVGAKICETKFGFTKDMVEAIENHTTGKPGMDILSKILYVSDSIGKDRKYEGIEELYELALKDIDAAIFKILSQTIETRLKENKTIHINTVEARNEYL